jgi:hypothetical protein
MTKDTYGGRGAPVTVGNLPGPITPRKTTAAEDEARARAKLTLDRRTNEGFARAWARFEASTPKPTGNISGRVGASGTLRGTVPTPKRKRRHRAKPEVPDCYSEITGRARAQDDKPRPDVAEGFGGALADHDLAESFDGFGFPDNEED